jgi:phosphoglycolate phosphatase
LTHRGIKLAILSNKPHHLTESVVSYYLQKWNFRPVFGQRAHVPRKPDPAGAIEIAYLMGIETEKILFVGDSVGDLKTSKTAGMVPVGVSWGYGLKQPDRVNGEILIDHPQEILSLID